VSTVQAMSPAAFDFVARKCLAKDPDRRWQTASDLVSQLEWIAQGGSTAALPIAADARANIRRGIHPILAVSAAIVLATVAAVAAWFVKPPSAASPQPMTRFSITLPGDQNFTRVGRHFVAISPDGRKLVYVANNQLYLRAIDQIDATPIRGTNVDPANPFFSPDSQWVGFYSSNQLRKIAIAGGAAVKLCDAANPFGASWTGDRILFGQGPAGIMEVSANGGTPNVIVKVDGEKGELAHGPHLLPDGSVLFTLAKGQQWEDARTVVHSLKTGQRKVLLQDATDARYVDTGHLVYGHDATILAVPFDLGRLEVNGGPVALVEGVTESVPTGSMQFDLSRTGTATFIPGSIAQNRSMTWVDRQGKETPIPAGTRPFANPRISPDGTQVAVEIVEQEQAIWVWELMRGTLSRRTFGRSADANPRWTPDGRRILYSSIVDGDRSVVWTAADGTGTAERLTRSAEGPVPRSVTPDGKLLVVSGSGSNTGLDLNVVPMEGQHDLRPLLHSTFDENQAEISPDGRWISYQSNESGMQEIYVRPFPDVDKGRWQVSNGGAFQPRWSRDGRELFFRQPGGVMAAVAVRADGSSFAAAKPVALFSTTNYGGYDVAPDGRFLVIKFGVFNQQQQVVVVQNWIEELKARVPAKP
jgi:Tol biopolymer transport system component